MKNSPLFKGSIALSFVVNLTAVTVLGYAKLHETVPALPTESKTFGPIRFGVIHLPTATPTPKISSPTRLSEAIARGIQVGKGDDDDDRPASMADSSSGGANAKPGIGRDTGAGRKGSEGAVGKSAGRGEEGSAGKDRTAIANNTGTATREAAKSGAANGDRSKPEESRSVASGERTSRSDRTLRPGKGSAAAPGGIPLTENRGTPRAETAARGNRQGKASDKDGAETVNGREEGAGATEKSSETTAGTGTFVMPRVARMWSVPPGQRIVLPEGLKLTLPKELPVMAAANPLSREQIEQLRKMLQGQNLRRMQGLTREQLKRMLATRKESERLISPEPASAPAAEPTPKPKAAAKRDKRSPSERDPKPSVASLPPGLNSPFRYRPWSPVWQQRYAPLLNRATPDRTTVAGLAGKAERPPTLSPEPRFTGVQVARADRPPQTAEPPSPEGKTNGTGTPDQTGPSGQAGQAGQVAQAGQAGQAGDNNRNTAPSSTSATGANGGRPSGKPQGNGSTAAGGGNGVPIDRNAGANTAADGGSGSGNATGNGTGQAQGGKGNSSGSGQVLGEGQGNNGTGGGNGTINANQAAGTSDGRQNGSAGTASALGVGDGAAGSNGGNNNTAGAGNAGNGGEGKGGNGGALGEGGGAGSGNGGAGSGGDTGGGGGEGGTGGGGGALDGFVGGELTDNGEGIAGEPGADSGEANGIDTGHTPAVGVPPNFPEHKHHLRKGIPGALVLPPLPPVGTDRGRPIRPKEIQRSRIEERAAPRGATDPQVAARAADARKPVPDNASAKKPAPPPLVTVVGSASRRGTVSLLRLPKAEATTGETVRFPADAPLAAVPAGRTPVRSVEESVARPARRTAAPQSASTERKESPVGAAQARQETRERKIANSKGIRQGSKTPIPPTPLPDSDAELGDGSGLRGEYYLGRNFEQYQFSRADFDLDFFWGADRSPSPRLPVGADWSCRWTGKIQPRYTDTYTFYAVADDGVRVWIDYKLVIDDWTLHPLLEYSGTVKLEAGKQYDIRVDYFESGGPPASLGIYWESAKQVKEFIPQECFFYPLAGSKTELEKYEKPRW
ncbi:MAG: PA14 domain-containing protein [Capsulimonadales bacterium]|nr:PA14 domain-containing protein [Capsulimonadales bacterium]